MYCAAYGSSLKKQTLMTGAQKQSTNPCILLSLGKRKAGMASTNPPLHFCQERLQIAQEVSLISLLHEP